MPRQLVWTLLIVASCGGQVAAETSLAPNGTSSNPTPPSVPAPPSSFSDTENYTESPLPGDVLEMALDDSYAYVIGSFGGVVRVPKTGGAYETLHAPDSESFYPGGIAVDDTHLYWAIRGSAFQADGTIVRCPKAGGPTETIATGQHSAWAVAVDESRVYWTNQSSVDPVGSVASVAKTGGPVTMLASGLLGPMRIAIDATNVYFSLEPLQAASLMRVSKSGGPMTGVAKATSASVESLAVRDGLLTWGEWGWSVHAVSASGETSTGEQGYMGHGVATRDGAVYFAIVHRPPALPNEAFSEIVAWTPGGTTRSLATASVAGRDGDGGLAVAVDVDRVYWIDRPLDGGPQRALLRSAPR